MKRISVLAGAVFALFTSGSAFAYDLAYTTTTANMRSGPTVVSRIVASLDRNTEVHVDNCSGGWCFAHIAGRTGYISSSLLEFNADAPPPRVVERTYVEPEVERTYVEPEYVYPDTYYSGPAVVFGCCGPYWHGGWHHGWYHHGWYGGGWHHWRR